MIVVSEKIESCGAYWALLSLKVLMSGILGRMSSKVRRLFWRVRESMIDVDITNFGIFVNSGAADRWLLLI